MIRIIFIISSIGLIDATYLTIKHYLHSEITCSLLSGCDIVTSSTYATILGVPVALLGVIFYGFVLTFSLKLLKTQSKHFLHVLLAVSIGAFCASLWFVYVQIFILNALCLYCMISAVLSTTILILSAIMMIKWNKHILTTN